MSRTRLFALFTTAGLILSLFGGAVAHAQDARCANTFITSPRAGSVISGVTLILGRAQLEGAFVRFQVDFSTTGLGLWVLINGAPQAIFDGTLARWDTTLIPNGTYDLRVRTIDTSGNYCESFANGVQVRQAASTGAGGANLSPLPVANVITVPTLSGDVTIAVPQAPTVAYCTPAAFLGSIVTRSIRLCAGQSYRPFTVVGDNLAVLGDANHTAVIRSPGRSFGIRVRGSNVLISGVSIRGETAPADTGNWLCLYGQCAYASPPILGGIGYGGGILLESGTGSTVMNSTVSGGVIGIAALSGRGIRLLNNQLASLSGWGIFGQGITNSIIRGNTLHYINRACTDPAGNYFASGCESAGVLLMGAEANLIADNVCARSGNCYYLNGEGERLNNFNRLYGNDCAAPSFNCFEITDAQGIEFDRNSAMRLPDNTSGCDVWLVRARVTAGRNNRIEPCNHRGSHLDSTFELPK